MFLRAHGRACYSARDRRFAAVPIRSSRGEGQGGVRTDNETIVKSSRWIEFDLELILRCLNHASIG